MMSKKEKLEDEMKELFYRAETHFKEAQGYLEAAYHVTCDLQRLNLEDYERTQAENILDILKSCIIAEGKKMNTSLETLKTELRNALGIEVGVENYEGESED